MHISSFILKQTYSYDLTSKFRANWKIFRENGAYFTGNEIISRGMKRISASSPARAVFLYAIGKRTRLRRGIFYPQIRKNPV
jgi:hypothetical protein